MQSQLSLEIYKHELAEVCFTEFRPAQTDHEAVCILYHGLNNTHHETTELAYRLAMAGVRSLCVEGPRHGVRSHPDQDGLKGIVAPDVYCEMYDLIRQQVFEDFPRLLQWIDQETQCRFLGVGGISMGGMTALALAAHQERVDLAISLIGLPDFEADLGKTLSYYQRNPQQLVQNHAEYYDYLNKRYEMVRSLNPAPRLAAFAPKPLFLAQGSKDIHVDSKMSYQCYLSLRSNYSKNPDSLKFFQQDVGHRVTLEMSQEAVGFFLRHCF